MPPDFWALLAEPFSRSSCTWRVVEVADDLQTARLARTLTRGAVVARLDSAVGQGNWSYQLLPLGDRTLVCNLSVHGVARAGTASVARGLSEFEVTSLADAALAAAAAQFGMSAGSGAFAWVEFDAEAGEPLYLPGDDQDLDVAALPEVADLASTLGEVPGVSAPVASSSAAAAGAAAVSPAGTAATTAATVQLHTETELDSKPAGHEVIERLLDRLREEGLGKEAARLVVTHGGYGRSQAEARELYRNLRALLVSAATVTTS